MVRTLSSVAHVAKVSCRCGSQSEGCSSQVGSTSDLAACIGERGAKLLLPYDACVSCLACDGGVRHLLKTDPLPISNRFLTQSTEAEFLHPLTFVQCERCGLLQLADPVPALELAPRVDWITYREPEGHLDALVELLDNLPGVHKSSSVLGVSFKDDSTLERFARRGHAKTHRLTHDDLGITHPGAGVETIQERLPKARVENFDVVIARHILEHAHSPRAFIGALRGMCRDGGLIVLEVPDCEAAISAGDCTMLWEEHLLYFTTQTYVSAVQSLGLRVLRLETYEYASENSLVIIAENTAAAVPPFAGVEREIQRAAKYADGLPQKTARLQETLSRVRRDEGPVAVFGAGHLSDTFVLVHGLTDSIDFFIDDHPKKNGLYMPGTRHPILGSAALAEKRVALCLLGMGPDSEDKVIAKQAAFVAQGGRFASILPSSRRALALA